MRLDRQFDVVTCMFAIHYFFASEKSLDNLFHNVSINLKDGEPFNILSNQGELTGTGMADVIGLYHCIFSIKHGVMESWDIPSFACIQTASFTLEHT